MSDFLTHECGIALVRLLKPLQYYEQRHKSPLYGFRQLFLLMEKQHNRGQDGAGIGTVKIGMPAGRPYLFRERSIKANPLVRIFNSQLRAYDKMVKKGIIIPELANTVKEHFDFGGEVLIGHLRYGTSGGYKQSSCHPYFRRSNWPTKNLMVLGNFNLTNSSALNDRMVDRGQHPIFETDTQSILEEIGFHLDEEHTKIYREMRGTLPGDKIPGVISERLDLAEVLRRSAQAWDGGFIISGLLGNGDTFVLRDPHGIRPAFYLHNGEVVAVASERVPLMTVFHQSAEAIREVPPGHALIVKHTGEVTEVPVAAPAAPPNAAPPNAVPGARTECSFERIYFSRGNDPDIYRERKALGAALIPKILQAVDGDLEHTVFSYVPNTAETAYYGLLAGLYDHRRREVRDALRAARDAGELTDARVDELLLSGWPRGEKVAHKDIKLRTFISQEKGRSKLVSHVYDITYGVVGPEDNLVVLDDSIVRGTTLRQSILKILARTGPKKIVIASTAPQIRYPDCYGIDMSELGKFIAFQAAVSLLHKFGKTDLLQEVYQLCAAQEDKPEAELVNYVRRVYEPFTADQISAEIAEIVAPPKPVGDFPEVQILFLSIGSLHRAIPEHTGDWYFTGEYPTGGGYRVLNRAYMNYYENKDGRSYG